MSAEQNDPIAELRASGFDDAANHLSEKRWHRERQEAEELAKAAPVERPAIPLLSQAFDQREYEGRLLLDALNASGVGRPAGSMPLLSRPDLGEGRR